MLYFENHEDLLDDMIISMNGDDTVSFLAGAEDIRLLMREITKSTSILPDLIEFNTEDEDGWYYLSLDCDEYDEGLSYSIVNAVDDDGEFFVLCGTIFADESVPSNFYEVVEAYEDHISCDVYTVRITEDCNGDCDNCPYHEENDDDVTIFTDDDRVSGFKKSWEKYIDGVKSSYSFTFHSSDEDIVLDLLKNLD